MTTLSRRMSAGDLAAVIERFEDVAHDVATARQGRVVKFIGDEVMFVTADADAACDIALTLVEEFVSQELADGVRGPGLRCEPAGRRALRGFDEPVSLLSVTRG